MVKEMFSRKCGVSPAPFLEKQILYYTPSA
jgi:hypothetical protein